MYLTTKSGRKILLNTPEEEAQIAAGIAADPDTFVPSKAEFAAMKRGRPLGSGTKTLVHIRLDTDMLDQYKATGTGWQTRMNQILRSGVQQLQAA
jgi:uncharacterized protein (DUF4415 family)